MRKRLLAVAVLALLCLGCAARDQTEQDKRIGAGVGAAAGAGMLAAVGNPCAGVGVLVQGALEATRVNDALAGLGRSDPDPKFVAFMEQLQREAAERRGARQRAEEAPLPALPETGGVSPADAAPAPEPARFTEMDRQPAAVPGSAQALAKNG